MKKRLLALCLVLVLALAAITPAYAADNTSAIEDLLFDVNYYIDHNPEVVGVLGRDYNTLLFHWVSFGRKEGRLASPYFNAKVYLDTYPDLKQAFGSDYAAAYNHFVHYGMISENRWGGGEFHLDYYKANYEDLRNAFGNNTLCYYQHHKTNGAAERRIIDRLITQQPSKPSSSSSAASYTGVNLGDNFDAYISPKAAGNMCVNVQYAATTNDANGLPPSIVIDGWNHELNEIFTFHYVSSYQAYYITPKHAPNYALNCYGADAKASDQLRAFASSNMSTDTHCLWKVVKDGNYYRLVNVGTGLFMDLDHGYTNAGTRINIYTYDKNNQLFTINKVSQPQTSPSTSSAASYTGENLGDNFDAYISPKAAGNMCVNVQYAATTNDANGLPPSIVIDGWNHELNEIFTFHYVSSYQAYYITPKHAPNYALNCYGADAKASDQLRAFASSNMSTDTHCLWKVVKDGNYYRLVNVGTGLFMDLDHGYTNAGTRINIYTYDKNNQLFTINKVSTSNDNRGSSSNNGSYPSSPVVYNQKLDKWKEVSYADKSHRDATAYSSACSVFSLATCITRLTGTVFSDDDLETLISYSLNNGYRANRSIATSTKAKSYGVSVTKTLYYSSSSNSENISKLNTHLEQGGVAYFSVKSSSGGHVMCIIGIKNEDGKTYYLVGDSYPTSTRLGNTRTVGWCTMDNGLDLHSVDNGNTIITKGGDGIMLLSRG